MKLIQFDCRHFKDWDSFHEEFAQKLGFPEFYGRNMNAWIDCLSCIDEPDSGMSSVHIEPGEVLTLLFEHVEPFKAACPDIYEALLECSAFVNWRRVHDGQPPLLALSFYV